MKLVAGGVAGMVVDACAPNNDQTPQKVGEIAFFEKAEDQLSRSWQVMAETTPDPNEVNEWISTQAQIKLDEVGFERIVNYDQAQIVRQLVERRILDVTVAKMRTSSIAEFEQAAKIIDSQNVQLVVESFSYPREEYKELLKDAEPSWGGLHHRDDTRWIVVINSDMDMANEGTQGQPYRRSDLHMGMELVHEFVGHASFEARYYQEGRMVDKNDQEILTELNIRGNKNELWALWVDATVARKLLEARGVNIETINPAEIVDTHLKLTMGAHYIDLAKKQNIMRTSTPLKPNDWETDVWMQANRDYLLGGTGEVD